MAALLGINVDRTISITFVIGAALAAVAGTLYLMYYGVVSFSDGFMPGVKAFTAAVLGGIGSLARRRPRRSADRPDRDLVVGIFLHRLQGRRRFLDPRHHADLPAARHSRPAGSGEGLTWRPTSPPRRERVDVVARAQGCARWRGLIALGLFLPLIGFNTVQNIATSSCSKRAGALLAIFVAHRRRRALPQHAADRAGRSRGARRGRAAHAARRSTQDYRAG